MDLVEYNEPCEVEFTTNGSIIEPSNDKIYLGDYDTPIVAVCSVCWYWDEVMPPEMYSNQEEYDALINHVNYCPEHNAVKTCNVEEATDNAILRLKEELRITGCSSFDLSFTSGRSSFRYTVDTMYKVSRREVTKLDWRPVGVAEVRQAVHEWANKQENGTSTIHTAYEADDYVVGKYNPDLHILGSGDKDVLKALEGRHRRLYTKAGYTNAKGIDIPPVYDSWVTTSKEEAMLMPYAQCLAGDSGDDIIGLYRLGLTTAWKKLKGCNSKLEAWNRVVEAYATIGMSKSENDEIRSGIVTITKEEAIERATKTMRLVNMHQLVWGDKGNVIGVDLWNPSDLL